MFLFTIVGVVEFNAGTVNNISDLSLDEIFIIFPDCDLVDKCTIIVSLYNVIYIKMYIFYLGEDFSSDSDSEGN